MNTLHSPVATQAHGHQKPLAWWFRGLLGASLLAGACATQAQGTPPSVGATPAAAEAAGVRNSDLDAPLFYQLLLGELNVGSGEPGTGYSLFLDAARKQKDAQLYRRAVDIALQARSGEAALTAAQAWSRDLPDSLDADRFVLQILLALNRVGESAPALRAVLQGTPAAGRNDVINAIPQTYARATDKAQALSVVREALAPSLAQPAHAAAAWTTIGRMELALDRVPAALNAAQRGHAAEAASPYPALLALELMERGETQAEPIVRQQLEASSINTAADTAVALAYARQMIETFMQTAFEGGRHANRVNKIACV